MDTLSKIKFDIVLKNAFKIKTCYNNNCNILYNLLENDNEMLKLKQKLFNEKNNNKREQIINKIINLKKRIDLQKCGYSKCLNMIKKYTKSVLDFYNQYTKNNKVPKYIDEKIKIATKLNNKKTPLNKNEMKELAGNLMSFLFFLKQKL